MGKAASQPFLRHAVVYGLGNTLLQAAGVLLLPLYTRFLSPGEYGALEVVSRIGEVVAVCLLFNGLRIAVLAMHGQSETEERRQAIAGTTVVVVAGCVAVGGLVAVAVSGPLGGALGVADDGLLLLGVLGALLEAACAGLLVLCQARSQSLFFVAMTFGQFLTRVGLCVLLVAGLGWGARGVLTASLVTAAAWAAVLAGRELARGGTRVDLAAAREMLGFALPLLLCGVGFFVMNSGDRFFLIRSAGPRQVGVYALGYKLVLAVCMFTRAPLVMVWGARLFQVGKAADAPEVFGRAFTRMLAVYVFAGLGLCLLVNEAIAVAAGDAYADAAALVPPIALAYFFLAWADLMDGAFFLRRRSDLKTWVALGSTALMVGLYAVLIPAWGAVGAAWATLGGFAGHAALTRLFSQRVFAIRHESGRVGAMLTLAVGLWALSRLLPISAWAIPARVGLWALWPAVLWFAGVVSAEEKEQVRAALRWVPSRVRAAEPPYPPIRSRCEEPPLPSEV